MAGKREAGRGGGMRRTLGLRWLAAAVAVLLAAGLAACQTKVPQSPKTFLVFFLFEGADLSPEAHQVVDQAAAAVKDMKPATVTVAGFAGPIGTPAHNMQLSERRIQAVEQALIADGVDPRLFL